MRLSLIMAAVGALALGAPAASAQAVSHAPIEAAPRQSEELKPGQELVKVRCRTEAPTGTRFGKRRCRRMDDLERHQEAAIDAVREMSAKAPYIPDPERAK